MSTSPAAALALDEKTTTPFRRSLLVALGLATQAVAIFCVAYFLLGGRSRDLHAPLRFRTDSSAFLMQSKVTLEQG